MPNFHLCVQQKLFGAMCTNIMLGGSGRFGCDGVCFPIHRDWNSRDVSMVGMCDCVQECEFYNIFDH